MMIGAIIGTIAIVLVMIVIGLLIDRKTPVLPTAKSLDRKQIARQNATHGAGEAPATALRVRGAVLDKVRAAQRCPSCRASMQSAPDDHVRYNDTDLLVLHFTCGSCAGKRTLYVSTRDP